jgi:hypothetical protein
MRCRRHCATALFADAATRGSLISFYSEGFPLEKAETYASLRKPFLVNDLAKQHLLLDRRKVYRTLLANNIAVPPHVIVSRNAEGEPEGTFEETEKGVVVDGVAINKPLVEKPISGEGATLVRARATTQSLGPSRPSDPACCG